MFYFKQCEYKLLKSSIDYLVLKNNSKQRILPWKIVTVIIYIVIYLELI